MRRLQKYPITREEVLATLESIPTNMESVGSIQPLIKRELISMFEFDVDLMRNLLRNLSNGQS